MWGSDIQGSGGKWMEVAGILERKKNYNNQKNIYTVKLSQSKLDKSNVRFN